MNQLIDTQSTYDMLKDFQKITVDFAYEKLIKNSKFLVADEVGLGKTMIAKGIIAKTIDKLKDTKKKIEIVYITTNQSIAAQNIETLKFGDTHLNSKRLSLLITTLKEDAKQINFRSFTVGTSLEFKQSSTGIKDEREFLVFLLKKSQLIKYLKDKTLWSFFKQSADYEKDFSDKSRRFSVTANYDVDNDFIQKFTTKVKNKYPEIKQIIQENSESSTIIKNLRKILVLTNLEYLQPDLIILDEFQRFSKLMTDESYQDRDIIEALFEQKKTKILLLSATPYKLLDCKNNQHYDEFYSLLKWLFKDENRVNQINSLFNEFSIKPENKEVIEGMLKEVMCRTERVSFSNDGMIEKIDFNSIMDSKALKMNKYLEEYKKYYDLNLNGITRYIRSAPCALNYMKKDGYVAKREFLELDIDKTKFQKEILEHPKLSMLQYEIKKQKLHDHIWMPPLAIYVGSEKYYKELSTKILIFSKWDFVPDSIVGAFSSKSRTKKNYTDALSFKKRNELLAVTTIDKNPYEYEGIYTYQQLIKVTRQKFKLTELEAKILLGSPANVVYRSMQKYADIKDIKTLTEWIEYNDTERSFSNVFLHFLGRIENYEKMHIPKNDSNKLEAILDYCIKNNIQSMFDEYIHLLTDSPKYKNKSDDDKIKSIYDIFEIVFKLRPNEVTYHDFKNADGIKKTTKFAMRISKSSMTEKEGDRAEKPLTSDNVKEAFNSPFAPFVLATTSIGQEGLDFHPYCHQIWHWEIPSNPVDLEQREGRVHRYKNYAVRKNVTNEFNDKCWMKKFKHAKQLKQCDFETFWLFSTKDSQQKIERVVPILPFSKEYNAYNQLIKQLDVYRTAIGQKHQYKVMNEAQKIPAISLKPGK